MSEKEKLIGKSLIEKKNENVVNLLDAEEITKKTNDNFDKAVEALESIYRSVKSLCDLVYSYAKKELEKENKKRKRKRRTK